MEMKMLKITTRKRNGLQNVFELPQGERPSVMSEVRIVNTQQVCKTQVHIDQLSMCNILKKVS